MNLKYLETFVSVVKFNSFSKAAKELYLSQPSVSSQIQNLEKEVGYALIERGINKLGLTREGKMFYKFAETVIYEHKKMLTDFSKLNIAIQGELNIVSSTIIGEFLLPKILGKYREYNPNIEFKTTILNLYQIENVVKKNANLVGFCGIKPDNDELESIKIGEDEQVLIVSPTHHLANRKKILLSEIIGETLLLRSEPIWINRFHRAEMLKAGFNIDNYQPKLILGTANGLVSSVEAKLGIGMISRLSIRDKEISGLLKVIKIKNINLKQELFYIHKKNDSNPIILDFTKFVEIWADKYGNRNKMTED
jgi:DNA-binding transcriptional LysR family regulator